MWSLSLSHVSNIFLKNSIEIFRKWEREGKVYKGGKTTERIRIVTKRKQRQRRGQEETLWGVRLISLIFI